MSVGLVVEGVGRAFGPVPVLRGIDLAVAAGTTTAVLGRSGCGKTTMLRLVAGFDTPDAGSVTIGDRLVAGPGVTVAPERRRIGYVTQEGNLFPHLSVAANVAFGLPRAQRRARAGVSELLELVGLDDGYASRRPHQLSGGEQQRVALARALARRPDVVLLDEPFSALDAELRASTRRAVMAALDAAGATTVLVTHDRAEALTLASRVAVMREGMIVQEGPPAEVYRAPVDRGVAEFLGDVVALPGLVRDGSADTLLGPVALPGPVPGPTVTVLVRPEQITIGGSGVATAVVTGVDFHGHSGVVRLVVDGAAGVGGDPEVVARCAGHLVPAVGALVRVSVSGQAVLATQAPGRVPA